MQKKVLLVDFDIESLNSLSLFIKEEGFKVLTATDGLAGFQKFQEEKPDLVIMEAMLPKLHGFELCARITESIGKKTPVFILTGVYKESVHKTEALRTFGASAYFEKPCSPQELIGSIHKVLHTDGQLPDEDDELEGIGVLDEFTIKAEAVKPVNNSSRPKDHRPDEGRKLAKEIEDVLIEVNLKPNKKERAADKKEDIDLMLEGTLAGLGLKTVKKKAAPVQDTAATLELKKPSSQEPLVPRRQETTPSQPPLKATPAPAGTHPAAAPAVEPKRSVESEKRAVRPALEVTSVPVKRATSENKVETGFERATADGHKAPAEVRVSAAKPVPEIKEIRFPLEGTPAPNEEPGRSKANPAFDFTFAQVSGRRRAGISMRLFVIAAAVLALGGSTLILLKPKGKPAVQEKIAPPAVDFLQEEMPATPDITQTLASSESKAAPAPSAAAPKKKAVQDQETAGLNAEIETASALSPATDLNPILPAEGQTLEVKTAVPDKADETPSTSPDQGRAETAPLETGSAPTAEKAAVETSSAADTAPVRAKLGDLISLESVDVTPQLIKSVDPSYTPTALKFRVQGSITVNALISEYGDVLQAAVIKSFKDSMGLDKSAENAVRRWKFKPAQKDGVSVRVWKPIVLDFKVK